MIQRFLVALLTQDFATLSRLFENAIAYNYLEESHDMAEQIHYPWANRGLIGGQAYGEAHHIIASMYVGRFQCNWFIIRPISRRQCLSAMMRTSNGLQWQGKVYIEAARLTAGLTAVLVVLHVCNKCYHWPCQIGDYAVQSSNTRLLVT
jgi:hypothetical protein